MPAPCRGLRIVGGRDAPVADGGEQTGSADPAGAVIVPPRGHAGGGGDNRSVADLLPLRIDRREL